jgi:hypothetical protein
VEHCNDYLPYFANVILYKPFDVECLRFLVVIDPLFSIQSISELEQMFCVMYKVVQI